MEKLITIEEALNIVNPLFVDVRSPLEYQEATIPGAINIPLFDNDERSQIGTVYRQVGPKDASRLGLTIASSKLPVLVNHFEALRREGRPIVVFCWRGGMRSKSLSCVLDLMNIPVLRLKGGYQAYRKFVYNYLIQNPWPHHVAVLHGLTGVGKTEILHELRSLGIGAIDLEGLAHNRGSVFGSIGMAAPPTQKMFEAELFQKLWELRAINIIVVECESRRVGRVTLPDSLMQAMRMGTHILLYANRNIRLDRLVKLYAPGGEKNRQELRKAISMLTKHIGIKEVERLNRMLDEGLVREIANELLTKYYDPLYKYPESPDPSYDLSVDTKDPRRAASEIAAYLQMNKGDKRLFL